MSFTFNLKRGLHLLSLECLTPVEFLSEVADYREVKEDQFLECVATYAHGQNPDYRTLRQLKRHLLIAKAGEQGVWVSAIAVATDRYGFDAVHAALPDAQKSFDRFLARFENPDVEILEIIDEHRQHDWGSTPHHDE